jgi:hypothetical protein
MKGVGWEILVDFFNECYLYRGPENKAKAGNNVWKIPTKIHEPPPI